MEAEKVASRHDTERKLKASSTSNNLADMRIVPNGFLDPVCIS